MKGSHRAAAVHSPVSGTAAAGMAAAMTADPDHDRASIEFQQALRRAFWRRLRRALGRRCGDLLPAGEVLALLAGQPQTHLGILVVPLDRVIGSSGRYRDFDLAFDPRRRSSAERWSRIAALRRRGRLLPPVRLFKVGDAYFVEDGNHRVSVARAAGEPTIRASVLEIDPSNLTPEPACTRLGYRLPGRGCGDRDADRP